MLHTWTELTVDGFRSGETDFAVRLAQSDQSVRDQFDELIMSPIVNSPDGVLLVIIGCSDRVDSGEGHAAALQLEQDASIARSQSADLTVLAKLGEWLTPAPTDWSEVPWLAAQIVAIGAIGRVDQSGTEEGRRKNRRVMLKVCRFHPEA